jgi:hypothetical protein
MIPAPAFACINCWSSLNNWLGILVNTSSENVCGGACLYCPRRTSVHFSNLLNNLALICVTGSLSQWGPLPWNREWGSLGLSCVGRFSWNTWIVILQNLPAGDISPLFLWKSKGRKAHTTSSVHRNDFGKYLWVYSVYSINVCEPLQAGVLVHPLKESTVLHRDRNG